MDASLKFGWFWKKVYPPSDVFFVFPLLVFWIIYEDIRRKLLQKTLITAIHESNFGLGLQREKSAKLLLAPIALPPPCYVVGGGSWGGS